MDYILASPTNTLEVSSRTDAMYFPKKYDKMREENIVHLCAPVHGHTLCLQVGALSCSDYTYSYHPAKKKLI